MEKRNKNLLMKASIIFLVGAALVKFFPTSGDLNELKKPDYLSKVNQAKSFAVKSGLDTTICFLADMSVHMGKKRLVVYDFQKDSILREMIVTHGSAGSKGLKSSGPDEPVFSNIPGSYASSLGKYKIGKRSYSNWGINIHYKLHGLESTNNNAFKRIIVLHSYINVDKEEVFPDYPPYSLGCPMVSNEDMRYLDDLLKKKKDVLLWMYN